MNWLLVVVGAAFLIGMIVGYCRGFIKIVVSLGATIATLALVAAMSPYVSKALVTVTPIDEMVSEKCTAMMMSGIGISEESEMPDAEIPRQKQVELLESADIPQFFRDGLIANNNSEVYARLGVTKFTDYVGAYVADLVVKMVAFLFTFIIVTILVRAIIFALDIITALPIIKGLNRIAGIAVGAAIALIVVWLGFFVITLMYDSAIGRDCFRWIAESKFLTFLYDENVILEFATKFR